jgi:hypothetical protein
MAAFSILPATAGSSSWSGNTVIFAPSADLAASASYQVSIGAAAQDSLGSPMGADDIFSSGTGRNLLHLGANAGDGIVSQTYHGSEFNTYNDLLQLGGLGVEHVRQRPPPDAPRALCSFILDRS